MALVIRGLVTAHLLRYLPFLKHGLIFLLPLVLQLVAER